MKNIFILFLTITFVVACKPNSESENVNSTEIDSVDESEALSTVEKLVDQIETAHHKQNFTSKEMVRFDIDLSFGGNERLKGTTYLSTDSKYIRIDKEDGTSLVYDGDKVWLSPTDADPKGARFDMFTWTYFFSLPYKLSDPGTITELKNTANDQQIVRLSFEDGTGDAPDDWYDIYTATNSNLIEYAGYIVTFGGTTEEKASENAHAIGYDNYQVIDGIPVAHSWKFYNYSNTVDTTAVIGEASISNIEFLKLEKELMAAPENAIEIKL